MFYNDFIATIVKQELNRFSQESMTLKSKLRSQSLFLSKFGAVTTSALWKLSTASAPIDMVPTT